MCHLMPYARVKFGETVFILLCFRNRQPMHQFRIGSMSAERQFLARFQTVSQGHFPP